MRPLRVLGGLGPLLLTDEKDFLGKTGGHRLVHAGIIWSEGVPETESELLALLLLRNVFF